MNNWTVFSWVFVCGVIYPDNLYYYFKTTLVGHVKKCSKCYRHMSVSGSKAWKNEADPNMSLENIEDFNVNSLSFLLSLNVSIINPWFLK